MSPSVEIEPGPTSEPFWSATCERRLVLQWCVDCDAPIHFPRWVCPACLGEELEWREASGSGSVHAFTVVHAAPPAFRDRAPYVVALVDLDEGARLMTNVVRCAPADVSVGMRVRLTWEALDDGKALPLFEPETGPGGSA